MRLLSILCFLIQSAIGADQDAFSVYWNIRTAACKNKTNGSIPLDRFGIIHNRGEEFLGDRIVIFYERKFGLCPYYNNSDPDQPINGGLPQNVNMTQHLAKVKEQIEKEIPDRNFTGIAVIDVEEFRPLYSMNWGKKQVYKNKSKELIREKLPGLHESKVESQAEMEYNAAAKKFFVETISAARELRPEAKWGYYDYPFCNVNTNHTQGDYNCSWLAQSFNDQMLFIWNASSALFPSIYLSGSKSTTQNFRFVQALLQETKRVAKRVESVQNRTLNIYAYNKFEYDPYTNFTSFYIQNDVCNTFKQAADLGMSGVVLWTTDKQLKKRCAEIAKFMKEKFGPYIVKVRDQFNECRNVTCHGNGNCVLRRPKLQCYPVLKQNLSNDSRSKSYQNYACHCDRGFKGDDCSERVADSTWKLRELSSFFPQNEKYLT